MKRKDEPQVAAGPRRPRRAPKGAAPAPTVSGAPDSSTPPGRAWERLELENLKKTLGALPAGSGWTELHERAAALARALEGA